ncbi:VWA domain-containing protein [Lujinxingia vulgaris]|uniref:VWA domain-containing protein n=1 Tax=Lujinxingia vulgaris TaxID=2600176 RepID=A0A5C6XF26_9DELT|nr:VWA domain-containing protein [Lujinxingia vulgaris]TXD38419.1 VWA domain-containing protein [Lujinxingia vulgaris]
MNTSQVAWIVLGVVVGLMVGLRQAPQLQNTETVLPSLATAAGEALMTPLTPSATTRESEQSGALQLSAELAHAQVLAERESETYLDVQLQTGESRAERRPALNVALVLDRSGSMGGEPMAQARNAAARFLERLQPGDRVSVVSFGANARVDVPSQPVDAHNLPWLIRTIDRIDALGATHLSGGIEEGARTLLASRQAGSVDRMIVMTDGLPTAGMTGDEELQRLVRGVRSQGISVTTLGFGTSYNADLMASLAEEGAGNYSYIARASDFEQAFSEELDALATTVATGVTLTLIPSAGVHFEEVYGMPVDVGAGPLTLGLGDLRAQTSRRVMVRVKTRGIPRDGKAAIRAILTYQDRVAERPVENELLVEASTTGDDVAMVSSLRPEVMVRVQEAIALRAIREATRDYSRGDQKAATERLKRERSRMEDVMSRFSLPKRALAPISDEMQNVSFGMERAAPSSAAGRSLSFERSERDLELERGEAAPGRF